MSDWSRIPQPPEPPQNEQWGDFGYAQGNNQAPPNQNQAPYPPYLQGQPYQQDPYQSQGQPYPQDPYQSQGQPPPYTPSNPPPLPQSAWTGGVFMPLNPQDQGPPLQAAPPPYMGSVQDEPIDDFSAPPISNVGRLPITNKKPAKSMLIYLYLLLGILILLIIGMGISQLIGNRDTRTAKVALSGQDLAYTGVALIARNETTFTQENVSSIDYIAEEGASITRGDPICVVYTTGFSEKEYNTLEKARADLKNYQETLIGNLLAPDTYLQQLDNVVIERALEIQALVRGESGNLLRQEELMQQAVADRQNYLRHKFADDPKFSRFYDAEKNQLQRIDTWTTEYSATDNGIISFYTDGLERVLASGVYNFTPQQVEEMIAGKVPQDETASKDAVDIYRLVRTTGWTALMISDDPDWHPIEGHTYQMLIESFKSTIVTATVVKSTKINNKQLVELSVIGNVEPLLYTRQARIQLSKNTILYSVPVNSLFEQSGMVGVVATFQEGEFFIPVRVISQDATQAQIEPIEQGYLTEGLNIRTFE